MALSLHFEFDEMSRLSAVTFDGCTGQEPVSTLKEALGHLSVDNPWFEMVDAVKAGEYGPFDERLDDNPEALRMLDVIQAIDGLWQYPEHLGRQEAGVKGNDSLNVLMLLANAIVLLARQDAELKHYREHRAAERRAIRDELARPGSLAHLSADDADPGHKSKP